jgi:ABC-type branched-subunit amino acid transport system substrate-binding protein
LALVIRAGRSLPEEACLMETASRAGNAAAGFARGRLASLAALAAAGTLLAACSSTPSATTTHAGGAGTVDIADIAPLTGSLAQLGQFTEGPCQGAVNVVNAAGGVLGHRLACDPIDDLGDPADAVANVSKALATNRNIVGVVGITSNTAATEVPIVNTAKITMVSQNGLSLYSKSRYTYFWRMTPPDLLGGVGMALAAADGGYHRVAAIFQNDVGDTGNQPGIVSALKKKGVSLVANLTIPGDESSYQSTVSRIIHNSPQALIISADQQTTDTLLSEYKGLDSGSVPPVIVPTDILSPGLFSSLDKLMGTSFLTAKVRLVGTYVNESTPEFKTYYSAVKATPAGAHEAEQIVATQAIGTIYDGIMVMALAMEAAHSTVPSTYNSYMTEVTAQRAGATEVHSFAQGVQELKSGRQIYYVGVTGPIAFDKYHNSTGEFASFAFTPSGSVNTVTVFPPSEVAAVAP